MGYRIRHALKQGSFDKQLEDVVESDETFIGGKNKNRHWDKKVKYSQGRSFKDKTPVLGLLKRRGDLRAFVVPNTKMGVLVPIIKKHVKNGSSLMTDEWYSPIPTYEHGIVQHKVKQYVSGEIHTNSLEGFWALLKRSILGIYHKITPKHLQKYVDEAVFRYNNRKLTDAHKSLSLLGKANGSLKYKQLIE